MRVNLRWVLPAVATALATTAAVAVADLGDPFTQPTTPAPTPAGATIFVKLGDINEDSTAANHKDEIPAEALD